MNHIALRLLLFFLLVPLVASADDNVSALQDRLRQEGFYFGDASGQYNDETAAAVTRYQIRNGLPINGKLDEATAKALGVAPMPPKTGAAPRSLQGTWRQLRNGEHQFVPASPSPAAPAEAPPRPAKPTPPPARQAQQRTSFPTPRHPAPRRTTDSLDPDRLRDYVAAFVLAGLDPKVGAELEFFADRVDYFDDGKLSRDRIRGDLKRYDARWPDRRFWLAGDLDVRTEAHGRVRVTFPLRYELRSRSDRASGTVRKTLVLQRTRQNDLEIVGVNERKMR